MWSKFQNPRTAMFSPRWTTPDNSSAPADWLDNRWFAMAVAAALAFHMTALFIWHVMPHAQVVQIPVRALDVKLGNGDMAPAQARPAPATVEKALSQMSHHEATPAPQEKKAEPHEKPVAHEKPVEHASHSRAKVVGKFNVRAEKPAVAAPVMPVVAHQFVREIGAPAKGDAPGSNQNSASTQTSYEQRLSLWLQKFKVYPETARAAGIQGDAVVRIRVDRQGNIGYYILERSSGYPVLDHAAIDMIKRANPVPPVPAGYPGGDTLEFMIPVNFHLQ